jgi:glucose uptake protein GlcU
MFFQMILCLGIWMVGFVLNCIRGFPQFYALPMLGGFFWSLGNLTVVPIIKTIGLGLGLIVWCGIELVVGWATARYGLFGINKEIPSNLTLNYFGVVVSLISTIVFFFVKSEPNTKVTPSDSNQLISILKKENKTADSLQLSVSENQNKGFFESFNPKVAKIIGFSLAIFSGFMYGESNTPILYVKSNYEGASKNNMDYLFAFYTGIFMSSIVYLIIYSIYKRNKPDIYPEIILPGLSSGIMWGCANICFFLATNALNQAISYPISTTGPSIVASIWGIFLYKEIRGKKNFVFFIAGSILALIGSVLCGLSF